MHRFFSSMHRCGLVCLLAGSSVLSAEKPTTRIPIIVKKARAVEAVESEAPPLEVLAAPAGAAAPAAGSPAECKPPEPFWATHPPVTAFPRPGYFTVPPAGRSYYSLRDLLLDEPLAAPPKYPYPRFGFMQPSFFDADWRYLDKPDNTETDFFDPLKRIHLGDDWLFTAGGEFRVRYHNEVDSRLTTTNNDFTLLRTRLYGDLWYLDRVRLYAEFLYADSFDEDLPPLPIDEDRGDFLNLFADVKLGEVKHGPVYLRVGRQELLYGSQRLISTLEWANTRRTFQGVKVFRHGEKLDLDAFCVQPVVPSPSRLDSVDNNQVFSGLWATYRPQKGRNIDLYYLNLDNTNDAPARQGIRPGPLNVSTVGGRYVGQKDNWLWDFEGALQFGERRNQTIFAQAVTAAAGYVFKDCKGDPQVWLCYDYASGDDSPAGNRTNNTYNQLFPFGHYYLGFLDQVGRQNIHDLSGQFVLYPTRWITALAQYHIFRLDSATDALYNAAGLPIRRDATGAAGTEVGEELDLLLNLHLSKHQDLLFGYSHLFGGDFIRRTGPDVSPDFFYAQYTFRF